MIAAIRRRAGSRSSYLSRRLSNVHLPSLWLSSAPRMSNGMPASFRMSRVRGTNSKVASGSMSNGLVAPFLIIYLHFGRGIPLPLAGSAVALGGITAVTSGLLAGALSDRLGPRNTLVGAMVCNAAAYLLYAQVTAPWEAFGVGLLVGVGTMACSVICLLAAAGTMLVDRELGSDQRRIPAPITLAVGSRP